MAELPKIHARRKQEPGKSFKIEKLDLEFSNGEKRTYERLCTHGLGAVIVVAMLDDETVLLVKEYAAGLHHYELGLVKGRLDAGETILEGAQRELKEEAGYGANSLVELTALSLAPGYMTHVTHVVLA
ncbi:MAG: NUDIX domain-containing protein, partial [Gammaproteobacteria bacterium]|nr:NUDIX domain-containing protein [Gammaproteobacteria bacterium]